jgi:pyrimidine-nucleoside phosphorylase
MAEGSLLVDGGRRAFLPDACPRSFLLWPFPVRPYELIKAKRDGKRLAPGDIRTFIEAYTSGDVPDYQMSALCMAVFFQGLDAVELGAWTRAMLQSGEVLDLGDVPGVKVDKHSTGGVGDKVSLSLAPLAAACGVPVPMISGRGLGHTGGTLDKLESIPGFRVDLPVSDYRRLVREVGCCLIGQTASVAPADKKLYALRDVTATVDCIPLICSSIMSKKLAEGIDALVLDVKVGSGAFMKTVEDARLLARTMIGVGAEMGRKVTALLTDMNQPLGRAVGNALEVVEAVEMLRGRAPADYTEVTLALTAEMLVLGGRAASVAEARQKLLRAVEDGSAVRKLQEIVQAQGGDPRAIDDYSLLPQARSQVDVLASEEGYVTGIQTEAVGLAAVALGAGRQRVDSRIDPAVGFTLLRKVGEPVKKGDPLVRIHYNDPAPVEDVRARLLAAYTCGPRAPESQPLILERLG